MNKNYYAVLMAGGVGSRFWPISTSENPKQFHDMLGTGDTLIQKTFKRLNKFVPTANILILTNERYNDLVLEQLPLVLLFKFENLPDFGTAWHQNKPGVVGIVYQQEATEGEITNRECVLYKLWVEFKHEVSKPLLKN